MKNWLILVILCGLGVVTSNAMELKGQNNMSAETWNAIKIFLILTVILIIIDIFIRAIAKSFAQSTQGKESEFGAEIKEVIPSFEEEDFLSWVAERFVKFQKSWSRGALEEIHPFETETLYQIHKAQMEELKQKGVSNIVEGISIKETEIVSFYNRKDKYEVVVHIRVTMRNYFISRDMSSEPELFSKSFNYYLMFEKQKENKKMTVCPACTAPLNLNSSSCEYCRTVFPEAMDQWLLAKIDVV